MMIWTGIGLNDGIGWYWMVCDSVGWYEMVWIGLESLSCLI